MISILCIILFTFLIIAFPLICMMVFDLVFSYSLILEKCLLYLFV